MPTSPSRQVVKDAYAAYSRAAAAACAAQRRHTIPSPLQQARATVRDAAMWAGHACTTAATAPTLYNKARATQAVQAEHDALESYNATRHGTPPSATTHAAKAKAAQRAATKAVRAARAAYAAYLAAYTAWINHPARVLSKQGRRLVAQSKPWPEKDYF